MAPARAGPAASIRGVTALERDARIALLDPALHAAGWTEELIRREETPGAVEIVEGRPRRAGHPELPTRPTGRRMAAHRVTAFYSRLSRAASATLRTPALAGSSPARTPRGALGRRR
jgi:hypothetical protein